MGLYTNLPKDLTEVDVIIAGGGSAGCIIASRLAEADPTLSILLVEGGSNNEGNQIIQHPAFLLANMSPESKTNKFVQGVKEAQLGDRELVVPVGGTLGGGSSTNFMMYSRASRSDYDSWKTPGWSTDELLPLINKIETYHGPGDKSQHGSDGPIQVSYSTYRCEQSRDDFLTASKEYGQPVVEDAQGFQEIGTQKALSYISPKGVRSDVASGYLLPKLKDGAHPNLHVLVQHQAHRILFDEQKRAVGVGFKPNPLFNTTDDSSIQAVKARKLVVLSCGALGTPPVLERSGVGHPEVIKKARVNPVAAVPGVGAKYEDHPSILYPYRAALAPNETLDNFTRGEIDLGDWIKTGDKRLGWNVMDVSCKWRPSEAQVGGFGPELRQAWDRDFKSRPDRPLVVGALVNSFPAPAVGIAPGQHITISNFLTYPYSRGHIHITGPNISDIDFKTGFLSDPEGLDIKALAWSYKMSREIIRRMTIYRGEVPSWHPPFPTSSAAACIEIDQPLENVQDIKYTPEDDKILEKFLIERVSTSWHSLGTCKMAPFEQGGVVDGSLNVYGVKGLKVADLSIPPGNVGAHTNNTAMAIGEKAADIIIRELGLGV